MAEDDKPNETPEGGDTPAEGDAPAEGAEAPKKKKIPLLLAIAVGAVILLIGIGGAVFFVMKGHDKSPENEKLQAALKGGGIFLETPPATLNLMSDQGGEHYLKMKLTLELGSDEDKAAATALMPRLQDDWNTFLRTMRPEDVYGSAAIQKLKEALLLRANQVLSPVVVKQVLMTEFLVQ